MFNPFKQLAIVRLWERWQKKKIFFQQQKNYSTSFNFPIRTISVEQWESQQWICDSIEQYE